jgi:glycosyltransferase involved in cell wall biosynthesis
MRATPSAEALAGVSCRLRIIGWLSDRQRTLLHECGVSFSEAAGVTDEQMVEEYRRCDILLFVSVEEGFGLPILEAQATGRVVVTSNRSSMPEVAGDGAELVDPLDVSSIRSGVLRVVQDPTHREDLVRRGLRNAKNYSVTQVAEQYAKLYREVAGAGTRSAS